MDNKRNILFIIDILLSKCLSWTRLEDDGLYRFIDPNNGDEISAHYGATHAAASFIIWGKETNNTILYEKGIALLNSILKRWDKSKTLPAFHFDFNNFALCMVEDFVDENTKKLIINTVLGTADSNHDTINWLPMRWVVNKKRLMWSSDNKYQIIIDHCRNTISKATNADGGVEDRLPHGMSFNLQYDLATIAVLQYLNVNGESQDLSKQLGFLLNAVAPDGDINYQGRGTNQIFAWGLWIYLLASGGQHDALKLALQYLSPRLPKMLGKNNMMLNEWDGKEKYLWWDYHYASVYIAHCMLWLIMAYIDFSKKKIMPAFPSSSETGLHIYRTEKFFVSWFEGRSEYLAEKGPAIAAIWSKKQGMICKGTFGPWQGPFGNKYIYEDVILKNYCGLISVIRNKDWSKNRYIHKLMPSLESKISFCLYPIFCPISVIEKEDKLEIVWENLTHDDIIFNIPTESNNVCLEIQSEKKQTSSYCVGMIKNQYGWQYLYQSHAMRCENVKIIII